MDEIDKKYERFELDENMRKLFSRSTVDIDDGFQKKESFIITTVVIDHSAKSMDTREINDAKLV
jgi:hypothetical protein